MINYEEILSGKLRSIKPSGIRKFFDILEEMTDVISLGVGEPDFITPWHIRDEGIYSLEKGFTKYTSNAGMKSLRKEISAYMYRRFNLSYNPDDQILVTVGGSEGIDLAIRALVEPGDEVIIPMPSFVCYEPLTLLAGGIPVLIETQAEDGFKLTPEQLKKAITPKTKLLIMPYPCNPTGGIMEKEDHEKLAKLLIDTKITVLSDEIYAELTYGQKHYSPANLKELYPRTLVVNGFSKAYAMTGWRLGYIMGPAPLIGQLTKLHQFAIMSAPTTSQYAAIEAMKEGDRDIGHMREEYDRRRRYLLDGVRTAGLSCFEPKGAFYLFPNITSTGLSSDEFCERFLIEEKVASISGTAFGPGGEGLVRMCYAASMDDLSSSLIRLQRFVEKYR